MRAMLFLLTLLFGATQAGATTFFPTPFPETVNDAPVIVRGIIGATHTDWAVSEDGGKRIYTYWELQVSEGLKGTIASRVIQIREMGGEKDGIGMQISGTAHFDRNEDTVVYLNKRNNEGSYDVWGMMTGKFQIAKNDKGQEYLIGGALAIDAHGGHGDGGHDDSADNSGSPKQWTFDALRNLIEKQGGEKPQILSDVSTLASPHPSLTPVVISPAPALQPQDTEGGPTINNGFGIGNVILGAIGVIIVVGLALWVRRRG